MRRFMYGRSERGFTLLELLLVFAIIAIIGSIAIADLQNQRRSFNSRAAITRLDQIWKVQVGRGMANGAVESELQPGGAYPTLVDMVKASEIAFPEMRDDGTACRSGYVFAVVVGEPNLDDTRSWMAYAWPDEYGSTGVRCFRAGPGLKSVEYAHAWVHDDVPSLPRLLTHATWMSVDG